MQGNEMNIGPDPREPTPRKQRNMHTQTGRWISTGPFTKLALS